MLSFPTLTLDHHPSRSPPALESAPSLNLLVSPPRLLGARLALVFFPLFLLAPMRHQFPRRQPAQVPSDLQPPVSISSPRSSSFLFLHFLNPSTSRALDLLPTLPPLQLTVLPLWPLGSTPVTKLQFKPFLSHRKLQQCAPGLPALSHLAAGGTVLKGIAHHTTPQQTLQWLPLTPLLCKGCSLRDSGATVMGSSSNSGQSPPMA